MFALYGESTAGSWDFQRILAGNEKNFKMSSVGRKRI
jgi:hypothetical protein